MILHRYFARRFLWMFLSILGVFALFIGLVDLVEQLRKFSGEANFAQVLQVTLLRLPDGIYEILPLVMILATASLFLMLARSSELVVVRASGRAGLTALMGPIAVALIISAVTVAIFNPLVAATSKRASALSESYESSGASVISIGRDGLWLRQGGPRGQTVIRASSANPDATILYDVSFLSYAPGSGPVQRVAADLQTAVQQTLDSYGAGINIVRVNFNRADPPSEVIDSFREVQAAQQERDRLEKEPTLHWRLQKYVLRSLRRFVCLHGYSALRPGQ